jgi:hypothetical protein
MSHKGDAEASVRPRPVWVLIAALYGKAMAQHVGTDQPHWFQVLFNQTT